MTIYKQIAPRGSSEVEHYCIRCERTLSGDQFRVNHHKPQNNLYNVCVDCMQERRRDNRYGFAPGEYMQMVKRQKGKCAICKKRSILHSSGKHDNLVVDHDHTTGKVRGLLCVTCNIALGYLESFPGWFDKARKYLEETGD